MSELKLISPLLDKFDMGDPISEHDGVRCCPAMKRGTDERYIVKVISIPASRTKLDALLLTGAYSSEEAALIYFKTLADDVSEEVQILQRLSQQEGFLPYEGCQTALMENEVGYQVYLLGTYKRSLEKHFSRNPMTHLSAVNLGLDLCAALAVCRRAGYLYVDLKPSNVYVSHDTEFKIGDLGFVRLDSLIYASLPDKYRSSYTAPELADPFAPLNTTLDTYAAGLILYQAYNNGVLPTPDGNGSFIPPEYADYEMAEIIMKACAANPADRWQDPVQMGQALVSYMQRNGVNDTPIVPVPVADIDDVIAAVNAAVETANDAENEICQTDLPELSEPSDLSIDLVEETQAILPEFEPDAPASDPEEKLDIPSPETTECADDSNALETSENDDLDFLTDLQDETDPANLLEDIAYSEVSDELSEILAQVDELTAHEIPEPAVAPDPVEIVIPDPIIPEDTAAENEIEIDVQSIDEASLPADFEPLEIEHEEFIADQEEHGDIRQAVEDDIYIPVKKRTKGWLIGIIVVLVVALFVVAGFFVYRNYYLMPINAIQLEGTEDTLTVHVNADADDSVLKVICADSHGNQITLPVVDGKVTFENLIPNTAYNIRVVTEGFHKLTGNTATAYSTPAQTNIVQFSAVTGSEDGSVILGFTVEGPDDGQWSVAYSAPGEEEKTAIFPSHMVTLTGLTIGKEYTFRLFSDSDLYVTGTNQITYTASRLVYAENLMITSFVDGKLSVSWDMPQDVSVPHWTVRCYNDSDYNETIITSDTIVAFTGLDHSYNYTVEVTAAGMSVSQRTFVAKNAMTASNFQADHSNPNQLAITWDSNASSEGWLLLYRIDGSEKQASVPCDGTSALIYGVVPGATYDFSLQDATGTTVLCEPFNYAVPDAQSFAEYNVTADDMTCSLYQAPSLEYKTTFIPSDSIYMKISLAKRPGSSDDKITVLFVTRDANGNVVHNSYTTLVWKNMWTNRECILAIPHTPENAGNYSIDIYFNGQLVTQQPYTIENAAE